MTESYNLGPENYEVFSDSKIVWMGRAIVTDDQVTYIPYATQDGQVGYVVRSNDGDQSEFIYLNASTGTDDQTPNVFLYQGESGAPHRDAAEVHFPVAEGWFPRFGEVELTPFAKDADGNWPNHTAYLYELDDGQLFEDSEGRAFTKVGLGPVQGSIEVVDGGDVHAYSDVTTRVAGIFQPGGAAPSAERRLQ